MLEWRDLREFPGWSVSTFGHIQNNHSGRILKVRQNRQGVVMVGLMRDGVQHTRSVARLVAGEFVEPESDRFDTIIHLNGDKEDCRAFNLMWRSRPFALRYNQMFYHEPLRVSVRIPSTGEYFYSLREACVKYGLVESMAYHAMINESPLFPYGWIIELVEE